MSLRLLHPEEKVFERGNGKIDKNGTRKHKAGHKVSTGQSWRELINKPSMVREHSKGPNDFILSPFFITTTTYLFSIFIFSKAWLHHRIWSPSLTLQDCIQREANRHCLV